MMRHDRGQGQRAPERRMAGNADAAIAFLEEIRGKRRVARIAPPQPQEATAAQAGPAEIRLIRLSEVLAICGKSRSSVYELIQKGAFPAPVKLGGRSSGWIKAEVLSWVENCIQSRQAK